MWNEQTSENEILVYSEVSKNLLFVSICHIEKFIYISEWKLVLLIIFFPHCHNLFCHSWNYHHSEIERTQSRCKILKTNEIKMFRNALPLYMYTSNRSFNFWPKIIYISLRKYDKTKPMFIKIFVLISQSTRCSLSLHPWKRVLKIKFSYTQKIQNCMYYPCIYIVRHIYTHPLHHIQQH